MTQGRHLTGESLCESFGPIADDDTKILILGSMPGERSLQLGEYYGHPRNRFWALMSALTGNDFPASYADKTAMLRGSGIGLWDVAARAHRQGSLDSALRRVEPNDIAGFVAAHKRLKIIAFNGQTAAELHGRHFARAAGVEYLSLPSTSPANATFSFERLLEAWRRIFV